MKKFDHLIPFQFKPAGTVSQLDMVRAELLSGARINDEQVHKKIWNFSPCRSNLQTQEPEQGPHQARRVTATHLVAAG